ncbi:MAG: hypothetical protein ABIP55_01910 [Tepidisphaeraceae bacterium]
MQKRQRGWRRVLFGLVAAIALGAATSVAVAWVECLRTHPAYDVITFSGGGWISTAPPAIEGMAALNWPQGPPPGMTPREDRIQLQKSFGWPDAALMRSVEWSYLMSLSPYWHGITSYHVVHGIETPLTIGKLNTPEGTQPLHRVLPTKVLARGFLLNTMLFAAGWFALGALIAAPGIIRRRRRARLGLCAGCGYDLRHSAGVCPECGRAIDAT